MSANCDPVDSYTVAVEYNTLLERECSSLMGGGGVYYGKIVEASESSHVSCDGYSVAEGYVVIYGCNTCTSKNIQERLKQDTIACTKQCRTTMNNCVYDGISNDWGGYYNTDQHPSCSLLKSTSLPGCAESSSSETVESSSSEFAESSSSEEIDSSSSEDENSSSSGGEECGTGTGHCPYSSSSFDGGPYGYVEDLDPCESKGAMSLGGFNMTWQFLPTDRCFISRKLKLPRFLRKPGFFGDLKFGFYCQPHDEGADWKNVFSIGTNIPYVYQESSPSAYCYNKIEDYGMISPGEVEIQSFYVCMNDIQNYVEHDPDQGCSVTTYGEGLWVTATIDSAQIVNSAQITDVPWFWNEEQVPSNFSLQQLISNSRTIEAFENCKETIRRYYLYELLSSSSARSSSSSEESSSSSQEESSSSSEEPSSSSSQAESSSSENVYSSSGEDTFVAGADQEYSPDQIFRGGLDNMEPGSCYSLNPDRGPQHGWINTNAQDSWWWREVDCESGEKVDRGRIGACPGFPLDNVPSNPKRTCVAYNGRCYRCKSENSYVDCSQEWLWKWSFNVQNIGTWYAEVDCYNPRYEGNVAGCLESKGLYKASIGFDNIVDGFDDVVEISSSKKYDAKGRMIYIGNETRNKMPQYRKVIKKELVTGIYSLKDNLQILSFVMVHGHVKASIKVLLVEDRILKRIGNAYNHLCKMRIITNIEEVYYSDQNSEIIQHEKEHERIYRTLEFVEWSENVSVQSSTVENQCEELKKLLWNKAKKKIEKMLNAQNEWDDSDPKNECKDRIDVKKELKKLEDEFYSTIPCYPCTVNENR